MKHDVHCFVVVRVKMTGVEARSHEAAVRKAKAHFHEFYAMFDDKNIRQLPDGVSDCEFGEEFSHFLVGEENDPEHNKTTWHRSDGKRVMSG